MDELKHKIEDVNVREKRNKLSSEDIFAIKVGGIFVGLIILIALSLFGFQRYQLLILGKTSITPTPTVVTTRHKKIAKVQPAAPQTAPVPAPTRVIPQAPMPKAPAPAVTPVPNSSVNGLTPNATVPPQVNTGGGSGSAASTPAQVSYTSLNWSGYLAASGKFTAVYGSWVVPTVTGNGYSATADTAWIGIGGVTSGDLIQAGTFDQVNAAGQVTYSAFYEMLPAAAQMIPTLTVSPGDVIVASISETTIGQWTINIIDQTSGQSYTNNFQYSSTYSSAEWIEEDPSYANGKLIALDNFGTVAFSVSSAVMNGNIANLITGQGQAVYLVNKLGQKLVTPSTISANGGGFTITQVGI